MNYHADLRVQTKHEPCFISQLGRRLLAVSDNVAQRGFISTWWQRRFAERPLALMWDVIKGAETWKVTTLDALNECVCRLVIGSSPTVSEVWSPDFSPPAQVSKPPLRWHLSLLWERDTAAQIAEERVCPPQQIFQSRQEGLCFLDDLGIGLLERLFKCSVSIQRSVLSASLSDSACWASSQILTLTHTHRFI